jgi:hypothetical protein
VIDDPRAAGLTLNQRHTLLLLPSAMDDRGRALDDTGRINGLIWGPLWREHGPDDLDADLTALAEAGYLTRYTVDGVGYLQMADWATHQVISRPAASQYPPPPAPEGAAAGGFGAWRLGAQGAGAAGAGKGAGEKWDAAGEKVRASVDELVDMVTGAADKLHDPAVQNRAVSFIADLAGPVDPSLKDKVRQRAHKWIGTPQDQAPTDVTVTTTVTSPPPAPKPAEEPPTPPVPPVPPVAPGEPRTQQPPAQPWTQQPETPRSPSGTDSE